MHSKTLEDRAYFLKLQLHLLSKLKHNITQVTLVFPDNPTQPQAYTDYVNSIPEYIGNTKIVKYYRPNWGMSYAGFSEVFGQYREEFDYYEFVEDDYVPCVDDWDSLLIEELEKYQAGYLCMQVGNGGGVYSWHAAVSAGILSSKACSKVWEQHGCIPHSKSTDYTNNEQGQVMFGNAFWTLNLLKDSPKFRAPLSMLGNLCYVYDDREMDIIVPVHFLEKNYPQLCMP
jgi:hypothetical protein